MPILDTTRIDAQERTRQTVMDGICAQLRGHKIERMGNTVTRIDGRYVNLWVMYQEGKRATKKRAESQSQLLVRIGLRDSVQNIGEADPGKVPELAKGVIQWMKNTPLDPTRDEQPD